MIGIDWGTSNFRAYRLRDGAVIDRIADGPGLLAVPPGGFEAALQNAIEPWLADGERQILLSGMVGSRQGWTEAAYLPCPADLHALAAAASPVPFGAADTRIVPGLRARDGNGVPEVMRGEEVQLLGVLDRTGPDALVCLPGTHSKWVRIEAGRIAGFATHMTGEAFAALRGHTILSRTAAEGPHVPAAFARGVARAAEPGGLLHHIFGVRTLSLLGGLADADGASYLSGLLIGHELRAAAPDGPVYLVGAPVLCALYRAAIETAGGTACVIDAEASALGLARLAAQVAWS